MAGKRATQTQSEPKVAAPRVETPVARPHLLGSKKLVMRQHVGVASDPETGATYELSLGFGSTAPMVRSQQTGRLYVLPWDAIVKMALDAGIEAPEGSMACD